MNKSKNNFKKIGSKTLAYVLLGSTLIVPMAGMVPTSVHAAPISKDFKLEETKLNGIIINNYGYDLNKDSYAYKTNLNVIYVPVREFAKAIGAQLYWDKDVPLRVILQKNNREFVFWYGNSIGLANNRITWMRTPPVIERGQFYCDVEPIARALNLLITEDAGYLDVTTEDQYEKDKLVNAAISPYEDIRFIVQKQNDNPMSKRQEAVWNFARNAKDTRNRIVNRVPYSHVDYTSQPELFKKAGPAQKWVIVDPTVDYKVFKKSGAQETINGAALRLTDKMETVPVAVKREITEYLKKNNYEAPVSDSTYDYLAHIRTVEVAKAFYDNSTNPLDTRTLINIDDYVESRNGNGSAYIPKGGILDNDKQEDNKDGSDNEESKKDSSKEETKTTNSENSKDDESISPKTNLKREGINNNSKESSVAFAGSPRIKIENQEYEAEKDINADLNKSLENNDRRYRVYTTGNGGHDTYRDSLGVKRFRREYTFIQPLHAANHEDIVERALSNYDIFRSLITKESRMGVASFSFKTKEGTWYEVTTVVAGNIDGLLNMDIEHGVKDYITNIDTMKKEKDLQEKDNEKRQEKEKKSFS